MRWQRSRGEMGSPHADGALSTARRLAAWGAFSYLLFMVGVLLAASDPLALLSDSPVRLYVALLFPVVGALLMLIGAWYTLQAWRKGERNVLAAASPVYIDRGRPRLRLVSQRVQPPRLAILRSESAEDPRGRVLCSRLGSGLVGEIPSRPERLPETPVRWASACFQPRIEGIGSRWEPMGEILFRDPEVLHRGECGRGSCACGL